MDRRRRRWTVVPRARTARGRLGAIRLSVDLTRLGDDRDHALALLLLTLRDLAAGRIPLGALVNRGFGNIDVRVITLTGRPWRKPVTLSEALVGQEVEPIARAWTHYLTREVP